jgi:hypothetical protein
MTAMNNAERRRRFVSERARRIRAGVAIQVATREEILRLLQLAALDIKATLAGVPSDFEAWRLPQLQAEVRRAIGAIEGQMSDSLAGGLDQSWVEGQALLDAPLAAAGVDIVPHLAALDTGVLMAMRSFTTDRIRDISTTAINKVNAEIAFAAIGTQTPFEAAQKVEAIIGGSGERAASIVRTELGTAYTMATQARMEQAAPMLPGLKKQWRRSGKLHPRLSHDAIDGQVQPVDQPFILARGITLMHPRDPKAPIGERINCGCSQLPYMDSWEMITPGRRPYSEEELRNSPVARLLAPAADGGF